MRYRISQGIVVKAENAAKPEAQKSRFLAQRIRALPPVEATFDYGCGKLRYSTEIMSTTNNLVVVDSEVQLSREQKIFGHLTTIREALRKNNQMRPMNVSEFGKYRGVFDRGFCVNVLSAIPIIEIRRRVVSLIFTKLRPGGRCLFVVQYRNSDFTRMKKLPNASEWRDGFILDSLRGYSFYGLISPEALEELVSSSGFTTVSRDLDEGRVYLWAEKPGKSNRAS